MKSAHQIAWELVERLFPPTKKRNHRSKSQLRAQATIEAEIEKVLRAEATFQWKSGFETGVKYRAAHASEPGEVIDLIVGDLVRETNIFPNQVERAKELIRLHFQSVIEKAYAEGVHDTYINYRDMPSLAQDWFVDNNGDIVTMQSDELTRIFVFPKGTHRRLPEAICNLHNASMPKPAHASEQGTDTKQI